MSQRPGIRCGLLACGIVAVACSTAVSFGQETRPAVAVDVVKPNGQPTPATTPADSSNTPGSPAKESASSETRASTTEAANVSAAQNTVKRPTAEKYVPQKIDTEIRKNPDGLVAFSIVGQPWEVVLQWLSDASALSLDWQELPGDSLNLITTHEYTMEQARDLINRHL